MRLQQLLNSIGEHCTTDCEITGVVQDSRLVKPGSVFVCIKGARQDGHALAAGAVLNGAVAVIAEHKTNSTKDIIVENSRIAFSILCKEFWGRPDEGLKLAAITGTNGKTTVTSLVKQIIEGAGHEAGMIGTIQNEIGTIVIPAKFTTPDPFELFALLARCKRAGCEYVVMEASSQALHQMRLYGLTFMVGTFTNLSLDHLDYHGNMEDYFAAKKSLFKCSEICVSNIDDQYGQIIFNDFDKTKISYGIFNDKADVRAQDVVLSRNGATFNLIYRQEKLQFSIPMLGEFSVYNALAAVATALKLGFPADIIRSVLSNSFGVKGRSELLYSGEYSVICDYAHTPDGLENILKSIKPFAHNRLVVLFGCAGERDRSKRPVMVRAVSKYADLIILTSDNPRGEDAQEIIDGVLPTLEKLNKEYVAEPDRGVAIALALSRLKKGDILVLCGKGHEDYQVVDGHTLYFDEHKIVQEFIKGKTYDTD